MSVLPIGRRNQTVPEHDAGGLQGLLHEPLVSRRNLFRFRTQRPSRIASRKKRQRGSASLFSAAVELAALLFGTARQIICSLSGSFPVLLNPSLT
jgi:hypothetical protein